MPAYLTRVFSVTISPEGSLWMATREGAWRSADRGRTWVHVTEGLPSRNVLSIDAEASGGRMLATAVGSRGVYESKDAGKSWTLTPDSGLSIRSVVDFNGHLLAATAYNGILMQQRTATVTATSGERSGGASQ